MENSPPFLETPSEQDDETQRLIGEVAKRHGIVLGSGDPLCVVLTVLELFLNRYLRRLDGMFQAHQAVSFEAMDRSKIAELRQPALFKQEYPANAAEAFQNTGHDSYIPPMLVAKARKGQREPSGPLVIGFDPAWKSQRRKIREAACLLHPR